MVAASAATAGAQGTISATKPFSIGVSAGASVPTGDLSNDVNTGYNVAGHITLGTPSIPLAFRGDVGYSNWGAKGVDASMHAWNFTGNAVYTIPVTGSQIRPYILGGVGAYKFGVSSGGTSYSDDKMRFGFNAGGGITIPLSGFNTFVEAKYTQVNGDGGNAKFIPVSVGVMF
jgi:hypothetical protein